jgi:hypothetical protein
MTGVVLQASEFAYLLLTVGAKNVLGLEAPELFPTQAKAQDRTYRQGWDKLIANGWVKPLPNGENAHEFDPFLTEMVAIIGTPRIMVVTTHSIDGSHQMLLHYRSDETTVELSVLEEGQYALGLVPQVEDIANRVSELMNIEGGSTGDQHSLPSGLFSKLQSAGAKSFTKKLQGELEKAGLDETTIGELQEAY